MSTQWESKLFELQSEVRAVISKRNVSNRDQEMKKLLKAIKRTTKRCRNLNPEVCRNMLSLSDFVDNTSYSLETVELFRSVLVLVDQKTEKIPVSRNRSLQSCPKKMYSIGLSDLKDTEETLKIFAPEPPGTAPNSSISIKTSIQGSHSTIGVETVTSSLEYDDDYGFFEPLD